MMHSEEDDDNLQGVLSPEIVRIEGGDNLSLAKSEPPPFVGTGKKLSEIEECSQNVEAATVSTDDKSETVIKGVGEDSDRSQIKNVEPGSDDIQINKVQSVSDDGLESLGAVGGGAGDEEEEEEGADSLAPLCSDVVAPGGLGSLLDPEVIQQVMKAKSEAPSKFASFWEMDEEDVDELTEEQIQNDPVQRILWAAEYGRLDVLTEMLDADPGLVSAADSDGYTPLHRAAYENHVEAVKLLLHSGADVNARTEDGWTPLHSATRWNQVEACSVLLSHGAAVNAQTHGNLTALHLAAGNQDSREALILLLNHPDIDATLTNNINETPFDICQRSNPYSYLFEMVDPSITQLYPR